MEQVVWPGVVLRWFFGALFLLRCQAIFVPSPEDSPEPAYCTVYNHLVKSGGTSIKEQLSTSSLLELSRPAGLCTNDSPESGEACAVAVRNSSVIMGYAELLRNPLRDIGRACQWFMMMRHPIDQLVSAFYYCPEYCGNMEYPDVPLTTRLGQFARRYWTNRIFRQMLHSIFCHPQFALCPPELRRGRNRPYTIKTEEGRECLLKIQEIMLTYTAVGISSEWELSMDLFDAVIVSPVRRWDRDIAYNAGLQSAERNMLLQWASVDPELHTILAADLVLYGFGVLIFKNQTTAHLGTVWGN